MPLVAWSPKTQISRAFARARPRRGQGPGPCDWPATSCKDHAGRCFLYPSYSVVRELRSIAAHLRCELPEHEFPVPKPVELIGIEPTTSSLQSWRSTN